MKMVRRYSVVETQSPDGEIHLILSDLKLKGGLENARSLNKARIKEIMKREAKKPLHLIREYE